MSRGSRQSSRVSSRPRRLRAHTQLWPDRDIPIRRSRDSGVRLGPKTPESPRYPGAYRQALNSAAACGSARASHPRARSKWLPSRSAPTTSTSFTPTVSYRLSWSRPIFLSSAGSMPSRLRKPFTCHDAAFRGLPVSHSSTFLRQRPRMRAALRLLGLHPQSRHRTWRCFNERFSVPIRRSRPSSLGNSGLSSRAGSSRSNSPLTLYPASDAAARNAGLGSPEGGGRVRHRLFSRAPMRQTRKV